MTFLEAYRADMAYEESIHQYIDDWHNSDSDLPLHVYLGMTIEQYRDWLLDPITLTKLK